jgi:L-lactate dehydrogenase complex protein LldF
MGISGVNFGVAETGTLCIVTNEGNASLSTSAPPLHVALMGIERIVPTLAELERLLLVLARSATGQQLSVYTDLITGPRRPGDPDGPDELHVVLVDNGRSHVLAGETAEALLCIRCGACLNSCPVYREIGGHAYGSVYSGPIGAVLTPALSGIGPWHELPYASSLCGACREVCPVRIDLPRMLVQLRHEATRWRASPAWLRAGVRLYRLLATRPALFRAAAGLARRLTRALAPRGHFRHLPPPLAGWTAHRDFPAFAEKPFSALYRERRTERSA